VTSTVSTPFDRIADRYDDLWTNTGNGRLQREAVWRFTDRLFAAGDHILDLGCGTGEDALHLSTKGVRVSAIDASSAMVEIARGRGVEAMTLNLDRLEQLDGRFDGALSNFGAVNCIEDPAMLCDSLARLIRRGGYFACCLMGRFCLWESLYYLVRGQFRLGVRRWVGEADSHSMGIRVFYPTVNSVCRAFAPEFERVTLAGIGIAVPPSLVRTLPAFILDFCGEIDKRLACVPGVRAVSDHRLLIFRRR
jgi:ubiquinone/menaquinone biosynthesis C-methylase UbiE